MSSVGHCDVLVVLLSRPLHPSAEAHPLPHAGFSVCIVVARRITVTLGDAVAFLAKRQRGGRGCGEESYSGRPALRRPSITNSAKVRSSAEN